MKNVRTCLVFAAAALSACASGPRPEAGIPSVAGHLGERVPEGFQNEVMVLGTPHLAGYDEKFEPAHLAATLDALSRFKPTRIAVESLPADEIALLAEHAEHDPAAAELLTMFGGRSLQAGQRVQESLDIERVEAATQAEALIEEGAMLESGERQRLVALLIAAYDWPSAVLQWSYLPKESRAEGTLLPEGLREQLNAAMSSANEIYSLAVPLARRFGLQRLHPVDSQYDGVRTLSLPRQELEAMFADPARSNWRLPDVSASEKRLRENAFRSGNLLPWYRYVNSQAFMTHDLRQWHWLFNNRHDGLDRFRYAMWELRNQRIVANVLDAAASTEPERVLVLIGAAHKLYLDDALAQVVTVRLRHFEEPVAAPPPATDAAL